MRQTRPAPTAKPAASGCAPSSPLKRWSAIPNCSTARYWWSTAARLVNVEQSERRTHSRADGKQDADAEGGRDGERRGGVNRRLQARGAQARAEPDRQGT